MPSKDKFAELEVLMAQKNYHLRQMTDCKETQDSKMDHRLSWNRRQSQFSVKIPESNDSSDYRSSAQQR